MLFKKFCYIFIFLPFFAYSNLKKTIIYVSTNTIFINNCDSAKISFDTKKQIYNSNTTLYISKGTIFIDTKNQKNYSVVTINNNLQKRKKLNAIKRKNKSKTNHHFTQSSLPFSSFYEFLLLKACALMSYQSSNCVLKNAVITLASIDFFSKCNHSNDIITLIIKKNKNSYNRKYITRPPPHFLY